MRWLGEQVQKFSRERIQIKDIPDTVGIVGISWDGGLSHLAYYNQPKYRRAFLPLAKASCCLSRGLLLNCTVGPISVLVAWTYSQSIFRYYRKGMKRIPHWYLSIPPQLLSFSSFSSQTLTRNSHHSIPNNLRTERKSKVPRLLWTEWTAQWPLRLKTRLLGCWGFQTKLSSTF